MNRNEHYDMVHTARGRFLSNLYIEILPENNILECVQQYIEQHCFCSEWSV